MTDLVKLLVGMAALGWLFALGYGLWRAWETRKR